MTKEYDVIVVGGGHAGIEAVMACANSGLDTALITMDINNIASMPCNPAIGGPAKGIITREIDALGGIQGVLSDKAMIQIKMLNESKGPAVRALRAQIDKDKFVLEAIAMLNKNKNITLIEDIAEELIVESKEIKGVKSFSGISYKSKKVILTTGTYMDSYILRGDSKISSGPDNQKTTKNLSESLRKNGFELMRLKTGTPPRVFTNSIDFTEVEEELLDLKDFSFSNRSGITLDKQVHCYITYTNKDTHKIVEDNMDKSSMYSGVVKGVGPRYCPSIEDKIVRFKDKERHQIFYEPTTKKGDIIYVNGFSTSMPISVQEKMLKTLPGMKNAKVDVWAYAIEYDAINPLQLKPNLESKEIKGLFFAGQINGTSGYEEAAGQGLLAGINASQALKDKESIILRRDQAYIGVLIDDLVTKGTKEPYRMLTSRAEYRLLLRSSNADNRLSHIGNAIGLVSDAEFMFVKNKYNSIKEEVQRLCTTYVSSKSKLAKKYNITSGPSLSSVLSRPDVNPEDITSFKFLSELTTEVRLAGYIKKQKTMAKKMKRLENIKINNIDFDKVPNIASEALQKLKDIKPMTIGQASRMSGINPADIQMILFYLDIKRGDYED